MNKAQSFAFMTGRPVPASESVFLTCNWKPGRVPFVRLTKPTIITRIRVEVDAPDPLKTYWIHVLAGEEVVATSSLLQGAVTGSRKVACRTLSAGTPLKVQFQRLWKEKGRDSLFSKVLVTVETLQLGPIVVGMTGWDDDPFDLGRACEVAL